MKAGVFNGRGKIELGERPDPKSQERSDALVRVVLGCGSGLELRSDGGMAPQTRVSSCGGCVLAYRGYTVRCRAHSCFEPSSSATKACTGIRCYGHPHRTW